MHLTERYRRLDHDTMEMQIIMDDPKAYTKPWVNPPQRFKLEPTWEIARIFLHPGRRKQLWRRGSETGGSGAGAK